MPGKLPIYTKSLPLFALAVPLISMTLIGLLSWRAAWTDAESDMQRAALAIAEYGQQTLEKYAAAADQANDRLRGLTDDEIRENEQSLHLDLKSSNAKMSRLTLSYVIDREGYPLLSSDLYPVPHLSLSDRDFFQALSRADAPEVYVSKTFIGRFDGRLLFAVARERRDSGNAPSPDGFDGVALVSVDPEELAAGMRRLLAAPTDSMAFMRTDGYGISTTSGAEPGQPLPKVAPESPFYSYAGSGADRAIYLSKTATPGSDSLLAMQKINGLPIYAVSLRPRTAIIALWWQTFVPYLWFGLPATIALVLLSLRVTREQIRLQATNVRLSLADKLNKDRLERTKRFGLVGTFEFDLNTGESRRSPEYMSIHGLPALSNIESHLDWEKRLYPADKERALEELKWALSDESQATEYGQSYRIVTADGDQRWIAARGIIERNADGKAVKLLGAHVDVTPLRSSELALADSDARLRMAQDAIGIGTWEWLAETRLLKCSAPMMDMFGFDAASGQPTLSDMLRRVYKEDRAALTKAMRGLARNENMHCEFRVERKARDGATELAWISARAASVALTENDRPRLIGICHDISERKRTDELLRLMAHEVEHRAKNILALITALLRMTKADSAPQLAQIMEGRIRALSTTMGLIGRNEWRGAELKDLVTDAVTPFTSFKAGGQAPFQLTGPAVMISADAAQPVAMAFHELATNASKYGALSTEGGTIFVTWEVLQGRVHVVWTERGGPPVSGPPTHPGFGSKLVAILFETQLGGSVTREWTQEGLICRLSFPQNSAPMTDQAEVA